MVHIKITKGLDIPIAGKPEGTIKSLVPAGEASPLATPSQIALNLQSFEDIKFRLLVKAGDVVKVGQPLAEDKSTTGRMFASPAAGVISEIKRGPKRALHNIVIEVAKEEQFHEFAPMSPLQSSREAITEKLLASGCFSKIRSRPFNLLANPQKPPRHIFVKGIESALFVPPAEMHVEGHEKEFQTGLNALTKLTDGKVHLVYRKDTSLKAFTHAQNVHKHTAEGPHPIGTFSVHIQNIEPIRSSDDNIWTVDAHTVVGIGHLLMHGRYYVDKIISIAGPGVIPERVGYFKAREGYPVNPLISGRIKRGLLRLISGDPLMGKKVEAEDFLGFDHYVFCVIPENVTREFLHFFGLGTSKYTFSKAYLTGHLDNKNREYGFTTNQHGEHRAFIDSSLYDLVMPLQIPTMLLVKAVMAEDYDLAETYGLLEVDSEDFALPTFVCPSKIEMTEIIKQGLKQYAKENLV